MTRICVTMDDLWSRFTESFFTHFFSQYILSIRMKSPFESRLCHCSSPAWAIQACSKQLVFLQCAYSDFNWRVRSQSAGFPADYRLQRAQLDTFCWISSPPIVRLDDCNLGFLGLWPLTTMPLPSAHLGYRAYGWYSIISMHYEPQSPCFHWEGLLLQHLRLLTGVSFVMFSKFKVGLHRKPHLKA